MGFLVGKQFYIVKNAADKGDDLAKDIIQNAPDWSDDELERKLNEFFGSSFDKSYEESRDEVINEVHKRLTQMSEKFNYSKEDGILAQKNLDKVLGPNTPMTPENIRRYFDQCIVKQYEYKTQEATSEINTPSRKAARRKWIEDEFKEQESKREIKHNKVALISLGNAGSGKSSAGGKSFLNQYGAYEIDPDNMKQRIPEFKKDPNALMLVHDESGNLADEMQRQAMEKGANLFIPKTGKSVKSIQKIVDDLTKNGYKIYMDFIDLDLKENFTRTLGRGLVNGRYTSPTIVRYSYGKNYGVFDYFKDKVNGWRMFNNDKSPVIEDSEGEEL